MRSSILYQKINVALTWNGLLFIFNKISKTLLSVFLYNKLSTQEFSIWANIYSLIFITLLWVDFGFSRSLPQYCIEFAKNNKAKKLFLMIVIFYKSLVATISGMVLFFTAPSILNFLKLSYNPIFFKLGCLLFITEGIKSIIRLIFYSYFWQKQFNLLDSLSIGLQSLVTLYIIYLNWNGYQILKSIFILDIFSGIMIIFLSGLMIKKLNTDKNYQGTEKINFKELFKKFILHSSVMWSLLSINSLTERNFLTPFLTHILGSDIANIFKVANDIALLFQRFIIKTIGTTGTSLFAHIEAKQVATSTTQAFEKLTKKIILLNSIILGITFSLFFQFNNQNHEVFKIVLLLTGLYLAQTIFMAYERILEVKRQYKKLFLSFLPYTAIILFLLTSKKYFNNLYSILLILQSLKISSLFIRIYFAKKIYKLKFPVKYTIKIILASISLGFIISNLFIYIGYFK